MWAQRGTGGVVASDRVFWFPTSTDRLWSLLTEVADYPRWWPWLREFDGRRLAVGEQWRCTVRPPVPYSLRLVITLLTVVEGRSVEARLDGDAHGTASLAIRDRGDESCEVHLRSRLEPSSLWLRATVAVAGPVARRGHDWVLDTGAAQFTASCRDRPSGSPGSAPRCEDARRAPR